jgi:hypothetical protein
VNPPVRLVQESEGLVSVSHGLLALRLVRSPHRSDATCDVPEESGLIADCNGVLAHSAWQDHRALVRIERWSGEPPILPTCGGPEWETTAEAQFTTNIDDQMAARELTADQPCPVVIDLPAGACTVRAYSRGRAEVVRRHLADLDDGPAETWSVPPGVEQHLFQLWST